MHHVVWLPSQPAAGMLVSASLLALHKPGGLPQLPSSCKQPDAAGLCRRCLHLTWHALHQQTMHSPLMLKCRLRAYRVIARQGGTLWIHVFAGEPVAMRTAQTGMRRVHASSAAGHAGDALGRRAAGGAPYGWNCCRWQDCACIGRSWRKCMAALSVCPRGICVLKLHAHCPPGSRCVLNTSLDRDQ